MVNINYKYLKPIETVRLQDEDTGIEKIFYELRPALDNFAISGSIDTAFYRVTHKDPKTQNIDPRTQILVRGINNIRGQSVPKRISLYKLPFEGLVIPETQLKKLGQLELDLKKVGRTEFRTTPDKMKCSYLVEDLRYREPNPICVISPKSPQLYVVLRSLGAPSDLLISK